MPPPHLCIRPAGLSAAAARRPTIAVLLPSAARQRQRHLHARKPALASTTQRQPAESYITDATTHMSAPETLAATTTTASALPTTTTPPTSPPMPSPPSPLAALPTEMLLRNLVMSTATASPLLLPPALALLTRVARAKGPLLSLERNPLLRVAVKKMLYQQFCAGENAAEVARTSDRLRGLGFRGVILCYGREVVLGKGESGREDTAAAEAKAVEEIAAWRRGNLETVGLAKAGDYVALK
jgi:hypothetical protein